MMKYSRKCILDIFDYSGNKLCNLYDNSIDASGQAYDVFVKTERNGWRELSFNIPSTIQTEEGNVDNYRLDFIKPDFKLRLIDDEGIDWFLITQPTQSHKKRRKDYSIKAGHVSQLLKTKKLDLEFSDTEGNNVGTPKEFLDYILDGTGWVSGYVDTFYEDLDEYEAASYHSSDDDLTAVWTSNTDYSQITGTGSTQQEALSELDLQLSRNGLTRSAGRISYRAIKRRSLKANAKTGAFKLIASMCDLFDAKPVYHGDTKTVDIIPINPFSAPIDGSLPDVTKADGVIELQYSANIKNVTRTMNSDNVITKLYAYGSFGDTTYGYCGIDECSHTEHIFTLNSSLSVGRYYKFTVSDDSGTLITRRFKVDTTIPSGSKIYFSMLDPTSQMYVWIEAPSSSSTFSNIHSLYWSEISNADWNKIQSKINTKGKAYILENNSDGYDLPFNKTTGYQTVFVKNWFSYVTDFEYFQEVGLLSDNNLQKLAGYQRFAKTFYQIIHDKSLQLSDALLDLSETIGEVSFCKLSVSEAAVVNGCLKLTLNKTDEYPDGIIYRSDDETTKKTKFIFNTTPTVKSNGDPTLSSASIIYIIHDTDPITWDTAYLKAVDNEDNPSSLTFHTDKSVDINNDTFFVFRNNNINGNLGSLQVSDESTLRSINGQLKTVTIPHDIQFYPNASSIPENITLISDTSHDDPSWFKLDEYAFAWDYGASQLYFCYYDHYGANTEREFRKVYFQNTKPSASELSYWYDWSMSTLYRGSGNVWTPIKDKSEIPITSKFGSVYKACKERDKYYKGIPEYYSYYASSVLAAGSYCIETDYDDMYVFTLQQDLPAGTTVRLNTDKKVIEIFSGRSFSPSILHSSFTAELGTVNTSTGELLFDDSKCRSASYIPVTAGQDYTFEGFTSVIPLTVCKYKYENSRYELVEAIANVSGYDGIISIESGITHIKILCDVDYRTFNSYSNFCAYSGQVKTLECKAYRFDNVRYHQSNAYTTTSEPGSIDLTTYEILNGQSVACDYDKEVCRSIGYIPVVPGGNYYITDMNVVDSNNVTRWCVMHAVYYDSSKNPISVHRNVQNLTNVTIPYNAYFVRFVTLKPTDYVLPEGKTFADIFNYFIDYRAEAYFPFEFYNIRAEDSVIIEDKDYIKLDVVPSGETKGINYLMKHFAETADLCYLTYQPDLKDAQKALDNFSTIVAISLGDMYREGYWQKTDYVDGDEKKLYKDAIDTIKKISRPTASYSIDYLDLYDSNMDMQYSVSEDTDISWPDLSIMSAAHLIDEEIAINCWAYIDVINKCYDKPWKTQINIDTEMSTMAQHTFADVIANIADVANSIKAKDSIIDRAAALQKDGSYYASKLQGAIDAANLRIFGGKTKWYTDQNGQLVFESEDGSSAMILTGTGLAVSSHKDVDGNFIFRTCITGYGITADEITAGYLSVDRIEAGMITVDKLVSTAGLELDISNNESIKLVTKSIQSMDGRLTNAELSIQPDQIRSIVQTVSTLDNYYSKSEIDQKSDAITLRVESNETDIQDLSNRIRNAELKITDSAIVATVRNSTQYTNDLAAKGSASDVNNLKTRMQTAEAKITADAIKTTVLDINALVNYYNKNETYTKTEVEQKANSIVLAATSNFTIGGRNLLRNTRNFETGAGSYTTLYEPDSHGGYLGFSVLYFSHPASNSSRTDSGVWIPTIDVEPDTEYTLSFYAKGYGTIYSYMYNSSGIIASGVNNKGLKTSASNGSITHSLVDSWNKYWVTWKTKSTLSDTSANIIVARVNPSEYVFFHICGVKLEKGNKPTDWTPAPEDLEERIYSAELKITPEAIQSTVSSMFNNYYTKSQIDQTAESIELSVSNNYLGKNASAVGVKTSSLTINNSGIAMTGGKIQMSADSSFVVNSNGVVRIEATKQDGSYISFGDGDFILGQNGNVAAKTGTFKESLYVGSNRVLTTDDIGEVLNQKIVVSDTQPSGHNILWFKPSNSSSVSTDISQSFICNNSNVSTWTTLVKGAAGSSGSSASFPLSKSNSSSIVAMGDGPYRYTVSFNMRKHSDSSLNGGYIYFDVDLEAFLVNSAGDELSLGTVTSTAQTSGTSIVNYSFSSNTNLLTASASSSLSLKVTFKKAYTGSNMAIEISKSSIRASCACSSSSSSGGSSSGTASQCTVYYIS